jgi:hypothetical protein
MTEAKERYKRMRVTLSMMVHGKEINYLRKPDVLIFETLSDRRKTEGSALEWKE